MKKSSLITVRDERSKKLLKDWGIKCQLIGDPVWGITLK
ncbi:MAG: polysaccharide pyruvyl transferase family protein [Clostridiales bacterium]|nr:polysaccharide pyruvyl transferase family protein [Clostridiales bacterium]